jgi:hypothetical protein
VKSEEREKLGEPLQGCGFTLHFCHFTRYSFAMRYPTLFLLFAISTTVFAASVCAQNPTMVEQQRDAERESHFAIFSELTRSPSADNQRKAYAVALEYLRRFEGDRDPDARTVRKFVTEYEKKARHSELFKSYKSKDYARTFELGRALLEKDPENFVVMSVLAQAGIDNAQAGNASLNEATLDYATRALKLIEAGKVTNAEPFKDIETARGYLNVAIGALLRDKSPVEAAQAFRKAVQSDGYRTDPLIYHRLGTAILRGEFAQHSKEYNEKYGNQPPSAAQREMLGRLNTLALQALDAYARAVALSDPGRPEANNLEPGAGRAKLSAELRNKILEQLTSLYKSLHEGSDNGLKELISTVLSKPLP